MKLSFDRFGDQEIWNGNAQVNIRSPFNRACVKMGRDLSVECFGNSCHFFHFPNTPSAPQRRLHDGSACGSEQGGKFGLCGQPFSGCDRYAQRRCNFCKFKQIVGWNRLFKPHG